MSLARLFGRGRRWRAAGLGLAGLGQAAAAAVSASAASAALASPEAAAPMLALMLAGGGAMAGALVAERRLGEGLAQDYVRELRLTLFEASVRAVHGLDRARLAVPFVGDLAAVHNWAARGPIRLLAAGTACAGGLIALVGLHPELWPAALPLIAAPALAAPLGRSLRATIGQQRDIRGGMTRFVLRRLDRHAGQAPEDAELARHRLGLERRTARLVVASLRRATLAAGLEAVAIGASAAAAATVIGLSALVAGLPAASVVGAMALAGFAGARLRDMARAEHARIAGEVAHDRILARLREAAAVNQDQPAGAARC